MLVVHRIAAGPGRTLRVLNGSLDDAARDPRNIRKHQDCDCREPPRRTNRRLVAEPEGIHEERRHAKRSVVVRVQYQRSGYDEERKVAKGPASEGLYKTRNHDD